MNIQLHIERLILEDLPIARSQRALVQAAVEGELARLITVNGVTSEVKAGGARPSAPIMGIQMAEGATPGQLGRQIAQAVYHSIGEGSSARE